MPGKRAPINPFLPPIALATLSLIGTLAATAKAPAAGPVAMVFPPWWSAARTIQAAAAAGPVIRLGAVNFVAIVAPADAQERALLHHAGAWFLLDPIVVTGCLAASGQPNS